jgi:hypothetical protein
MVRTYGTGEDEDKNGIPELLLLRGLNEEEKEATGTPSWCSARRTVTETSDAVAISPALLN